MGMDVYGNDPKNRSGEYFRRSMGGWAVLADYVTETFPALTEGCTYWHSNDGDGLNAEEAAALAVALRGALADGSAALYVRARNERIAALPLLDCRWCEGTGRRTDAVGKRMGMTLAGGIGCNGCDGEGKVQQYEAIYVLEVADIEEFAEFVENSGGFEIH